MRRHTRGAMALLALAALLWCSGCAILRPSISMPDGCGEVVVPLQRAGDLLFVQAQVNGHQAGYFVLDTGACGNAIDRRVVERMGLPWVWRWTFHGIGGKATDNIRRVDSIELGDLTLAPHLVGEISLGKVFGDLEPGIIGYSAFWDLPFTVDHRAAALTFYRREAFDPPEGVAGAELRLRNGLPYVRAVVDGRQEGWFLLDTGASGMLGLAPHFTRDHPEYQPGQGAPRGAARGIGGAVSVRRGVLGSLTLLGHEFRDVPYNAEDPGEGEVAPLGRRDRRDCAWGDCGTVGIGLLRNFRLTFDYRQGKVWAEYRRPESVAEMIARGEDLNAQDLHGHTLLHRAVVGHDWPRAAELIAAGADVNTADNRGATPLAAASRRGASDLVAKLLAAGADPNIAAKTGATALMFAAQYGSTRSVVALLLCGADVAAAETDGDTALLVAAAGGKAASVKALVQCGAALDAVNGLGGTALMVAAYYGKTEAVEVLLAAGADVAVAENTHGATALHLACQENHAAIVRLLAAAAADLQRPMHGGVTPLMHAAEEGLAEIVELLVARGADVGARDGKGWTALHYARHGGHSQVVKLLEEHAAKQPAP